MTLSGFTDFVNLLGLVDGKTLRLGDLDTDLKASTNSTDSGSQNIAAITRSEFMEAIVRVAIDKFHRSQLVNSEVEAVEKLVFEFLLPAVSMLESDKWRYARYLNEECAGVLTNYEAELVRMFGKYSGKNTLPGERQGMSLEEFQNCCLDLLPRSLSQRLYGLCFQLALCTQTDCYKRQNQLNFPEFLEALSRTVDFSDSAEPEKAIFASRWDEVSLDTKLETVLKETKLQRRGTLSEVRSAAALLRN